MLSRVGYFGGSNALWRTDVLKQYPFDPTMHRGTSECPGSQRLPRPPAAPQGPPLAQGRPPLGRPPH